LDVPSPPLLFRGGTEIFIDQTGALVIRCRRHPENRFSSTVSKQPGNSYWGSVGPEKISGAFLYLQSKSRQIVAQQARSCTISGVSPRSKLWTTTLDSTNPWWEAGCAAKTFFQRENFATERLNDEPRRRVSRDRLSAHEWGQVFQIAGFQKFSDGARATGNPLADGSKADETQRAHEGGW